MTFSPPPEGSSLTRSNRAARPFIALRPELTAGLGGNASIERRIARTIASLKRSSILFGVSIFSAKNTGPVGHSTHPTHQPMRPSQPVFAQYPVATGFHNHEVLDQALMFYPKGQLVMIELPEKCNLFLCRDSKIAIYPVIAITCRRIGVAIVDFASNSVEPVFTDLFCK